MKFRPPSWMSTIKMTLPLNVRTVAMSKVLNPRDAYGRNTGE